MLAKLHCNEFSLEKLHNTQSVIEAELQATADELQSLTEQLAASRQCYQQLQKEHHDAGEMLRKEVVLTLYHFKTRGIGPIQCLPTPVLNDLN